jgi:uncharacterized protein (DUF1697 family)
MPRYVALFRGINVGKAKRVAMADLRELLASLGYSRVATLLNSGNAVFSGDAQPAARHGERIRAAVAQELHVDALVIVKSQQAIAAMLAENRLLDVATDHSRLLVAMTAHARTLAGVRALARHEWGAERLQVGKHAAYLWCANGILESKVATGLLNGLAGTGTTRNCATLNRIHALMTDGS